MGWSIVHEALGIIVIFEKRGLNIQNIHIIYCGDPQLGGSKLSRLTIKPFQNSHMNKEGHLT
jgi:hypothetical protein